MKKNKLTKLLVGLLLLGFTTSCSVEGGKNSSSSNEISSSSSTPSINVSSSLSNNSDVKENNLSLQASIFVNNVNLLDIENISLADQSSLDAAYVIYNSLSETDKSELEVIAAKQKLDEAKNTYLSLYNEYLTQREAEERGYLFAQKVEKYSDTKTLTREDKEDLESLSITYSHLPNSAKELEVVIDAKNILDTALNYVLELVAMPDSQYEAVLFVASVLKLPSVEDLSVLDIETVNSVLLIYTKLSSESRDLTEVIDSKELLDTLVNRCSELALMQGNVDSFINLVYSLPNYSSLKWQNAEQNAKISEAELAYENLTAEEKEFAGVNSAYSQLMEVRKAFDNLKEPYDISKVSASISLGAMNSDGNYTSTFTYASGKDHITVLKNYYGTTKEDLTNHVKVYLNLYYEAGAVNTDPIYRFDITENYSGLDINDYVEVLKQLRDEGNTKAQSGAGYNFTVNIESLNDNYASSEYTGFFGGQKIYF